jgi:hypothetical protein
VTSHGSYSLRRIGLSVLESGYHTRVSLHTLERRILRSTHGRAAAASAVEYTEEVSHAGANHVLLQLQIASDDTLRSQVLYNVWELLNKQV